MTILQVSQCQSLNIDTLNLIITNQSVMLSVTYNCDTTTTIPISPAYTSIDIIPEDIGMTSVFSDGIYSFELTIVTQSATIVKEVSCHFMNCATTCVMLPKYSDLKNPTNQLAALSFYALNLSNQCADCACADLCALYTNITNASTTSSCGCN